ncbi:type II CRISPR RNA-guided endonuclease Cas9 [Mogibacterium diversum]|uniref:type II CRISPR RNA-guided endonuclease Cas9 n=1 Tax=Mogibacterium diversum TaxID=114527 RepID=UPI0028D34A14|nr:type II CRISPR RNA-guided endonuclease Cas9 [Mogibacterium diversum]
MDNKKEYYIGLDMGTNSVGWAVTDTEYNLMRAKGKDLWGVRLFTEAQPAVNRRTKRVQRRRIEREKARKAMLKLFFSDAIDAVDPGFFQRLDESFLQYEDRSDSNKQMNALFNDGGYIDFDYYNEYPTIFHLRKALLHEDREFDVRLVYLAILNMFSHRGHFLNTNMSSDDDRDNNFDSAWRELIDAFETSQLSNNKEINNISALLDTTKYTEIKQIIGDRGKTRSSKFDALRDLLDVPKSEKHICAVLKLVCGLKVTVKEILSNIENPSVEPEGLKVSTSFTDSNLEENLDKIQEVLEDEYFDVILKAKSVYEICLLSSILGNNKYLSDSRVEMYERHKQDLQDLKSLLAEYDKYAYEKIFRTMDVGSYSAYVGSMNSHGNKIRRLGTTSANSGTAKEELYKLVKKVLNNSVPENNVLKVRILDKIEKDSFLEKQLTSNNGVIPNQVHTIELKRILSNAEIYLKFLQDIDEDGLSVKDKIIQLFEFQIPYYVGPLGREFNGVKGYNNWAVRTEEGLKPGVKIMPWNFDKYIDKTASAAEFIKRMLRKCSYMSDEYTLPKHSLAYEKFMVLNEINNIKIDNERISVKAKQGIYNDLFATGNKVSRDKIKEYLVKHNDARDDVEITGLSDETCTTKLASLGKFRAIFGDDVFKQSNKDIIEDIIYWSTIYNGDRKIIREKIEGKYPNTFNKKQLNKILGFKFEGWGNLSKKFLELQGTSKVNGEIDSVIGFMWNKQENLMELLSDNYTFTSQLNGMMNDTIKPLSSWKIEDLEDMYLSPSVKRMVWQTMKIVDELQSVIGYAPKRVFVEVTRGDGEKKRTTSRKQKLIDLYKSIKGEAKDWIKEIENRDESAFKSRKLFLYYMQQGMCMYSGEKIDLDNLMNDNLYDLDHIYPQHFTKDDSIHNNLVLVKKEFNARKSDMPITKEIQAKMHGKWKALLDGKFITSEKYARLTRHSYAFSDDEKAGFINRQLVETSQATKAITKIFSQAFDNNTKIVFSKARLVSDFRQKFELPKSRVLNCYHHANDAYLNIVVGNSYYVKFEGNPARFIKESKGKEEEKKYKYHLSKFFENTVQNKNEVAWSVEEGNNTITTVKRTMAKYSPLVTYKTEEGKGEYFKETIYPKSKAKPIVYTGLKSKNTPLNDVKKYGGKTAIGTSGYCFVKYTEKNKEVRKFETLPIYLGSSRTLTVERIQEYLKESYLEKGMIQAAETVEVLIKFVPQKTELVLDGHTYTIGGSTGDMMYINGIVQVKLSKDYVKYFQKLEKAKETNDYSEIDKLGNRVITQQKNAELIDIILDKMEKEIFQNRKCSTYETINEGRDKFKTLDINKQVTILIDVINNIYGSKQSVDLTLIGGKSNVGMCRAGRKISNCNEAKLHFFSCTGIYVKEIDLLKI